MKRSLLSLVGVIGIVSAFVTGGCSSGPTSAEVMASCNGYCDAYAAAACEYPTYANAAECKTEECGDTSGLSQDCREAVKDYYDCAKAQSQTNICNDDGCDSQALSILTSCLAGG
jgi:hypothetical protein